MTIKPLNNCVLVKLVTHQTTESGLEMPVKEEDKSLRVGEVVELSEELENKTKLVLGDKVVFGEYAYDMLVFQGNSYAFLEYSDIIGKIN